MAHCEECENCGDWEQFCEKVVDKLNAEYAEVLKEKLALEQMVKKDLYQKCMRYIPMYRKDLFEFCKQSYNYCDMAECWKCDGIYEDTPECLLKHITSLHITRNPKRDDTKIYPVNSKGKCKYKPITSAEEYQWEVMMEGEDDVDSEGESLDDDE